MERSYRKPDLGTGVYSYVEAARILQVSDAEVRRWAQGYCAVRQGQEIRKEPVLRADTGQPGVITFPDLVELRFVKWFREQGVRLPKIVAAAERLSEELQTPYPFACKRLELQTDGSQILDLFGDQRRDPATQQMVFEFVSQFFRDIDFDPETCLPDRWYPMGRQSKVVIDRHHAFGAPSIVGRNVRTDILYATYKAENGDADLVAEWYDVPKEAVLAAVDFEERWQRKAA